MSHLLYRARMIAFRQPTFCRLGLTPSVCIFTVTFPFLFKCTGGVLNDSVPVGLSCSHGLDVHPSSMVLCSAVFAEGWLSPRPFVDCGKSRPYDQLTTPSGCCRLLPPTTGSNVGTPAKALVICYTTDYGIRTHLTSYGGTAARMPLVPRLHLSKNRSATRSLCFILIPAAPRNLSATFARPY